MNPPSQASLFAEIAKPEHRAAPEVIWAQMRREPVSRQEDGTWVVTGYDAVRSLMHDPRLSSDKSKAGPHATIRLPAPPSESQFVGFIDMDPPHHERARRAVMSHFGPPTEPHKVLNMETEIARQVTELLDHAGTGNRMDVVDQFAYPLPVAVISTLLGVPASGMPRFQGWFAIITNEELQRPGVTPEEQQKFGVAVLGWVGLVWPAGRAVVRVVAGPSVVALPLRYSIVPDHASTGTRQYRDLHVLAALVCPSPPSSCRRARAPRGSLEDVFRTLTGRALVE